MQPWAGSNDAERTEDMRKTFRRLFSSTEGKKVFNVVLNQLCYFRECTNAEEMTLNNFAKFLLREDMGITDSVHITDTLLEAYTVPEIKEESKDG